MKILLNLTPLVSLIFSIILKESPDFIIYFFFKFELLNILTSRPLTIIFLYCLPLVKKKIVCKAEFNLVLPDEIKKYILTKS